MNPYLHAPKEWAGTPLGAQLEQFGWRPTHSAAPYGPIWMLLMVGLGHAPFSVVGAAFAVKTLLSLCATGSAVLVWHILTLTRPGRRLFGLAAFTWNPLLVEITGEGHNDAVMVFAVLAAVWFVIRQRHRTGALALTVATLTKYVPVILAPAFLVFQARTAPNGSRLARQWMTTASVCAVAIALAFVPLWAGRHTFDGLQTGITLRVGPGTSGLLIAILSNVVDRYTAVITVGILVLTTFIIGSAAATRQVVDANTLVHACATICLLYVLVATPRLWPWYALLPCAMLCASGGTGEVWQAGVLSFCCRTIAPLSVLHQVNAIGWTDFVTVATAVGAGLPLLWWATASVSVQSLHRRQPV